MRAIPPALGFAPVVLAAEQPQYETLHAERYLDAQYGTDALVTRWQLDPEERARLAAPEVARAVMVFAAWLIDRQQSGAILTHAQMLDALRAFASEMGYDLNPRRGPDERVDLWHTQLLGGQRMQPILMAVGDRATAAAALGLAPPPPDEPAREG